MSERLWIEGLQCGANYSVYMESYSHVGPGNPSDVLTTRTVGRGGWLCLSTQRLLALND